MKLFLFALFAGATAHKGHGAHHHHHHARHLEEYDEVSPKVQELQKELFVASILAAEQCGADVRDLCGSPDVPQLATEPFILEDEDSNTISASFVFFRQEGSVRSLASAATRVARRKLFVLDGGDKDKVKRGHDDHGHHHDGHHHHDDDHHHHKDHHHKDHDHDHDHKKRPCHRPGLSQQPLKLGFGPSVDRCLLDVVGSGSPDVSEPCSAAVKEAEAIKQQLDDEIMMEEMAEQLAGLLFFFGFFLLSVSLLSCAMGNHHQKRFLRRSIIAAVYEDPSIKAAVEAKTGLSLGSVAPIRHTAPPPPPGRGRIGRLDA
mmetsp:Transcript_6678/g.12918  ORF Transcript_6678/g.12918 Transcript_6678/m.12918 type:complete len:317 (+) Transcript_6678:2-952(+)